MKMIFSLSVLAGLLVTVAGSESNVIGGAHLKSYTGAADVECDTPGTFKKICADDDRGNECPSAYKYDKCKASQGTNNDELCEAGEGNSACTSASCLTINEDSLSEDPCKKPS